MKIKLLSFCVISLLIFSSCEKCKDCEIKYQYINNENVAPIYELVATLSGYNSFDEYWNSLDSIQSLNKEYCDEELDEKTGYNEEYDTDSSGVNDFRVYYDCK